MIQSMLPRRFELQFTYSIKLYFTVEIKIHMFPSYYRGSLAFTFRLLENLAPVGTPLSSPQIFQPIIGVHAYHLSSTQTLLYMAVAAA